MKNINLLLFLILIVVSSCTDSVDDSIDFTYNKADSPHYITQNMDLGEDEDITIEAGAELIISDDVIINIKGDVIMEGTAENPIIINPENPGTGWGKISLKGESEKLIMNHVHLTDGIITSYNTTNKVTNCTFINTQNLTWESAILRFWFGSVEVTDNTFTGINKVEGVLLHDVNVPMVGRNNFTQVPDGVEFINCEDGVIFENVMNDGADDAIDLNGCIRTTVRNNVMNNCHDAGIEIGSENFGQTLETLFEENTIVGSSKGIWLKDASYVHALNCTFENNGIGVDVVSPSTGDVSSAKIESCTMTNNGEDIRKDNRSEVEVID